MIEPRANDDELLQLAAERHRYEMLQVGLDLLDQGLTVFDENLKMVAWNDTFLRLLGFPRELAFVGADFESFIRYNAERGEYGPGDVDALVAERVNAARRFSSHVTERVRPDGRILLARGEPLPHKGFVTLYTDITEQRYIDNLLRHQNTELEERVARRTAQLENANAVLSRVNEEKTQIAQALKRSEERIRLITDTIPAMIGYFDKDEVFRYANRGYADWFGVAVEAFIGHTICAVVGETVYNRVRDNVRLALTGRQVTYEYLIERQGRPMTARSTLVPEIGADGEVLGCFVFAYDVTEQKQMQLTLVQAQKMDAIGQLTGGLAHDFNNLLTVVIGNLAALQERHGDDAGIREFTEPALQSARRGVQLIRRLQTFSRQQPLEPMAVDIARLVVELTTLIERSLPESIAISTELADTPMHCLVDPGQLESALLNFALNARDAMPDGGRLRIAAAPLRLSPGAVDTAEFGVPAGDYIRFEVADDGCGMDAATLARAFEPFFTTKQLGLGSGLGLAMTQGFARQSGGGIRIASAPGQGTTVQLVLPQCQPELPAASPEGDGAASQAGDLVLLVEDDPAVRRVVRQQLVGLGYAVIEADNGAQALQLADAVPDIALVLTDMVMPGGINGRQLIELVRQRRPGIGVVLMSGYAEGLGNREERTLRVLDKPFSTRELADALQRALKEDA
ncbi:PAS-domain containing protein [Azospira restricta]|uniref:histidine kinase n=1 Tax=Azospira restricta TaxID=404405 RepID=A0A974SMK4_9RHOO|nr:PAS-domain containing protein [Azospira restricta]QRJ62755.1 PAS-domain containing protein [Azospira restricta]